jgi:hypothetical protein
MAERPVRGFRWKNRSSGKKVVAPTRLPTSRYRNSARTRSWTERLIQRHLLDLFFDAKVCRS